MRLLILHVDSFRSVITQKGRSRLIEEVGERETAIGEGLVALASVERDDEANPEVVAQRAAQEILRVSRQLKAETVVLHPFAHLFGEPGDPSVAVQVLDETANQLRRQGLKVQRTPFGWFNTLELQAKGHPLSRIARRITPD